MSYLLQLLVLSIFVLLSACAPVDKNKSHEMPPQALSYYKMALAHLQGDNSTQALKELLLAEKYDPRDSSIQEALAQTYQRKRAYSLAEEHFHAAIRLDSENPSYHHNLATLYLDEKEWDKAIASFDTAAQDLLFDNAHIAHTGKAYAYFKKQEYSAALNSCNDALAHAPRYARPHFLKSKIYAEMGEVEMQKISLRRTIEIAPQYMIARYQLAVLLLHDNNIEEAKEQLETILEFSQTSEVGYAAKKLYRSL